MRSGGIGVCRGAGVTYCVSRGSIRGDSVRFSPLLFSFRVGKLRKKGAALEGICIQPKIIRISGTWDLGPRARRVRNVGFRVRGLGGGPQALAFAVYAGGLAELSLVGATGPETPRGGEGATNSD